MSHIKRRNSNSLDNHEESLLRGLPDDLARLCLSSLPPSLLFSVCHSWRRLIYSPSFTPFFSLYALLVPSCNATEGRVIDASTNSVEFFSFDPFLSTWQPLPSPPRDPPLNLLFRHPSFLSRNLPIQSVSVSNSLVLIAATTHQLAPALSRPLVFNPESKRWSFGPPFSTPRRWCATGSARGAVYVASGFGSRYRVDVARSMEQWDLNNKAENWKWEKKAQLKNCSFSREAVEAVASKGKVFMVNVKGNAVKEGAVYDVESNKWKEMPEGMLAGWNGPAATMDEDEMYVADEGKGTLSKYDAARDCWEKVTELPQLRKAEQIAAGRGRVCAVCRDGESILVVDVASRPARIWELATPSGFQAVALHILPRMSSDD